MQAIDTLNKGIRELSKKRLNFWLYLLVIACTIAGLCSIFVALSSMEWVKVKVPANDVFLPQNWKTLYMGLSYTRTDYRSIQNADLNYTFMVKTSEMWEWFSKGYRQVDCGGQAEEIDKVDTALSGSMALILTAVMLTFAAFIIVYLSMQKVRPFKYPNFVSGLCYILAAGLYMGQVIYFMTKLNGISNQKCFSYSATYDFSMLWAQGMVILNIFLMTICGVAMFFLRKPSAEAQPEVLSDSEAPGVGNGGSSGFSHHQPTYSGYTSTDAANQAV